MLLTIFRSFDSAASLHVFCWTNKQVASTTSEQLVPSSAPVTTPAILPIRWYATSQIALRSTMYWKEGDVRGASCLCSVLEMGMVEPGHMNGGADAQIVPAGPATDVMDDENDKVSQDVVGTPLGSGIHEFQWSQAGQSSALQRANVTQCHKLWCLVSIGACQWSMPSSSSTHLSLTLSLSPRPSSILTAFFSSNSTFLHLPLKMIILLRDVSSEI